MTYYSFIETSQPGMRIMGNDMGMTLEQAKRKSPNEDIGFLEEFHSSESEILEQVETLRNSTRVDGDESNEYEIESLLKMVEESKEGK